MHQLQRRKSFNARNQQWYIRCPVIRLITEPKHRKQKRIGRKLRVRSNIRFQSTIMQLTFTQVVVGSIPVRSTNKSMTYDLLFRKVAISDNDSADSG